MQLHLFTKSLTVFPIGTHRASSKYIRTYSIFEQTVVKWVHTPVILLQVFMDEECSLGKNKCIYAFISVHEFQRICLRVQVGGWNPGILWNVVQWQSSLAVSNSKETLFSSFLFNVSVFGCFCGYWQQIVQCVNDKPNKYKKDISSLFPLNGLKVCIWGRRWRMQQKLSNAIVCVWVQWGLV